MRTRWGQTSNSLSPCLSTCVPVRNAPEPPHPIPGSPESRSPPPVSTAQTFYNLVSNFTDENYSMGLAWCSHRQLDEEDLGHYQNLSNQTKQKQQQQHYYNVSVNATEWDALEKIACSQQSFMKTRLLSCINKRGRQAPTQPANLPQPATQPAINPLALLIISSPAYP